MRLLNYSDTLIAKVVMPATIHMPPSMNMFATYYTCEVVVHIHRCRHMHDCCTNQGYSILSYSHRSLPLHLVMRLPLQLQHRSLLLHLVIRIAPSATSSFSGAASGNTIAPSATTMFDCLAASGNTIATSISVSGNDWLGRSDVRCSDESAIDSQLVVYR